jgi:hypothetical protein
MRKPKVVLSETDQEIKDAQDAALASKVSLDDLLIANDMMKLNRETYDTELTIGLDKDRWGDDAPDSFFQIIVLEEFFKKLNGNDDAIQIIAAFMKNAADQETVRYLEERRDEEAVAAL